MKSRNRSRIDLGLNAVILAVTDEVPRVLTVRGRTSHTAEEDALPFGPFDPDGDRTLELGLRRWVREQAGLELGYVEQLYTFGDQQRDPHLEQEGVRSVSIAYLALVRERTGQGANDARWRAVYDFFPWEDWRQGRPAIIEQSIESGLHRWIGSAQGIAERRLRRERADIAFGLAGVPWDGDRALERYELLYEAGLVFEARPTDLEDFLGQSAALDHRRILASALGRVRGKIRYRPVVFELLAPQFTLLQLQRVVEALAGIGLHKQNFRRLVEHGGLVEGTGKLDLETGGRPAELFVFRREVLRERPAPGVGLPGVRR
jgi:hypothetical protein